MLYFTRSLFHLQKRNFLQRPSNSNCYQIRRLHGPCGTSQRLVHSFSALLSTLVIACQVSLLMLMTLIISEGIACEGQTYRHTDDMASFMFIFSKSLKTKRSVAVFGVCNVMLPHGCTTETALPPPPSSSPRPPFPAPASYPKFVQQQLESKTKLTFTNTLPAECPVLSNRFAYDGKKTTRRQVRERERDAKGGDRVMPRGAHRAGPPIYLDPAVTPHDVLADMNHATNERRTQVRVL